ncbi:MAG TPA: hypothetical protein VK568_09890 [Thermodesulfobacteriota bacterium]|jgi:hypothetical protein|nr:hypothetical protein [Thermodesulfobacteriota bacterium]
MFRVYIKYLSTFKFNQDGGLFQYIGRKCKVLFFRNRHEMAPSPRRRQSAMARRRLPLSPWGRGEVEVFPLKIGIESVRNKTSYHNSWMKIFQHTQQPFKAFYASAE